jgi:hypothetical protein
MIRVASQFTFCSPEKILRRMVVEIDELNALTRLVDLDTHNAEPANTLFYDGILSAGIISVKQNKLPDKNAQLLLNYNYIKVTDQLLNKNIKSGTKPLLFDFNTDSVIEINRHLKHLTPALTEFSIFEIIAACTYYPALLLNKPAPLSGNSQTGLILWEEVDLVNKRITEHTRIRLIR